MYVSLNPPALTGYHVLVGAIGCLEQTNSLGNLKTGTPTWSPQGHHNIKHFVCTLAFRPAVHQIEFLSYILLYVMNIASF